MQRWIVRSLAAIAVVVGMFGAAQAAQAAPTPAAASQLNSGSQHAAPLLDWWP